MSTRATWEGGSLTLAFSFDPLKVDALKRTVPADSRRWDPARKVWLIDGHAADVAADFLESAFGVRPRGGPGIALAEPESRVIELLYLARCKDRGGESSAMGWVQNGWNVIFPESVLRAWFDPEEQSPTEMLTLYAVLAIRAAASVDDVRAAYRRMARQWHPDVCREPDAAEQFRRIKHAYDVLAAPMMRRKYDAGLAFQSASQMPTEITDAYGFRAPLRCGWVLVAGHERLGRFVAARIDEWADIEDTQGRVMVSSWPMGNEHFETRWQ